jgi:transposase, IS5 family
MGKAFKKSTLQQGIKALSDKTWEQIILIVLDYAKYDQDIEKGWKIRVDCTVVESNIHDPYDSELLVDANRVLNMILVTAKAELSGINFSFTHHLCRVKRRHLEIMNVKNTDDREQSYKDLIEITENTIGYGAKGLKALTSSTVASLKDHALIAHLTHKLQHFLPIARQVICQTRR